MCYNCGCRMPDDDMGSSDNITNKTFKKVAQQQKLEFDNIRVKVYQNLEEGKETDFFEPEFTKAAKAWGQSEDEVKKNTQKLLKDQLKGKI